MTEHTPEISQTTEYANRNEIAYDEAVDIIQALMDGGYIESTAEEILDMNHRICDVGVKIPNYMSDGPGMMGDLFFVPLGDSHIVAYLGRSNNTKHPSKMIVYFMGELPSKE